MSGYGKKRNCADCGQFRQINGRGLCGTCYFRHWKAKTLSEWALAANHDNGDGAPLEGLTYRQIDYWVRRGYLRPAFAADGSGSSRCWSADERAIAATMRLLTKAGLTVETAHRVARSGETKTELAQGVWLSIEVTP